MSVYETPEVDAVVHPSGWVKLPSGIEVTAVPLVVKGAEDELFAHLDYDSAERVAAREGAKLAGFDTITEIHRVAKASGLELAPVFLHADASMASLERCREHDMRVHVQLAVRRWDGKALVANAGKHWIAGAPDGRSYLRGWWDEHGQRFVQSGTRSGPGPHNNQHKDYATTTVLQRGEVTKVAPLDIGPGHGYRCAVRELKEDAEKLGTWRTAADVRTGRYRPKTGDLVCSTREGGMHVERIADTTPTRALTIGGNEQNTWILDAYDFARPVFEGMIDVPPEIGSAASKFALAEHRAQIREVPGPKANPKIQAYHAGARRGGGPTAGMPGHEKEGTATLGPKAPDETAWCASSASWCAYQAMVQLAPAQSAQSA